MRFGMGRKEEDFDDNSMERKAVLKKSLILQRLECERPTPSTHASGLGTKRAPVPDSADKRAK